jgi:hypothetical protein
MAQGRERAQGEGVTTKGRNDGRGERAMERKKSMA